MYWLIFEESFFDVLLSYANPIRHYVLYNYCYVIRVSMPMLTSL